MYVNVGVSNLYVNLGVSSSIYHNLNCKHLRTMHVCHCGCVRLVCHSGCVLLSITTTSIKQPGLYVTVGVSNLYVTLGVSSSIYHNLHCKPLRTMFVCHCGCVRLVCHSVCPVKHYYYYHG